MAKIANVYVNIPVKSICKAYSYLIPGGMEFLCAGWRVVVPFGGRNVEGFIVEVAERYDVTSLKPILSLVDDEPWFNDKMMELAYWMSDYYLCSAAETMRLFMPGKSGSKIKPVYRSNEGFQNESTLPAALRPLYQYIKEKKETDLPLLYKFFAPSALAPALQALLKKEAIYRDYAVKKKAGVKLEKYLRLDVPFKGEEAQASFTRKPAQKKLLEYLDGAGEVSFAALKRAAFSLQTIQEVCKTGFVSVTQRQVLRDSYQGIGLAGEKKAQLTPLQRQVFEPIEKAVLQERHAVFLLYGITGSGKTQVYIETVRTVRRQKKKAVVLVPEIGLTMQMIERFKAYFPEEVIVMHSRLSLSERNDAVTRMRLGKAFIVIGARSAIFTPMDDIGVIIMDEEHDVSYKQDESPRYHTRDIAVQMAKMHQAILILGSATPSVESFRAAEAGEYKLLTMRERICGTCLPQIQVVDMRSELRLGRRTVMSQSMQALIKETLAKGEQFIILLNRRGFSTFVMCRECGYVVACVHCSLPLTYHKDGTLKCHFCDVSAAVPDICPKCASRYIKYFGSGTEKLEDELRVIFPAARVVRMDRDTTGKKFAHAEILKDFSAKRYDILLGTQMVAKGHDIENVTGVGIISADSSLNLPDFRAAEKCFSLITQAAGRAGRGLVRGNVVVQAYNPDHYAVKAGALQDYEAFYRQEILLREQLGYPPYSDLIKLTVQRPEEKEALVQAEGIAKTLKEAFSCGKAQILGPIPAAIPKLREQYRYILLLKIKKDEKIKGFIKDAGIAARMDVTIDVNPLHVT